MGTYIFDDIQSLEFQLVLITYLHSITYTALHMLLCVHNFLRQLVHIHYSVICKKMSQNVTMKLESKIRGNFFSQIQKRMAAGIIFIDFNY